MAYTDPTTRTEGDVISAANWNTDLVDNIRALYALFNNPTPTGALMAFAGTSAPTGWLLAYGQAVSRITYAPLFAVLGTIYGAGDGTTTFNLPDLRGRIALAKDNMGGSSANRVTATQADNLGQSAGEENHTLTEAEIPAHTHTIGLQNTSNGAGPGAITGTAAGAQGGNIANTGGGGAHNNLQPYITMNYIVKI